MFDSRGPSNSDYEFSTLESRSGQIDLRTAEGDWCNVLNAGLGIRPTTDTGNTLIDAIVGSRWRGVLSPRITAETNLLCFVPPSAYGTSNTSSPRYDPHCGQSDAAQPAPEAGTWCE
jgi:cellulose 1,4-beta-cellobiosidase